MKRAPCSSVLLRRAGALVGGDTGSRRLRTSYARSSRRFETQRLEGEALASKLARRFEEGHRRASRCAQTREWKLHRATTKVVRREWRAGFVAG
eukprot:4795819-Pleurochrysis_carterae.AAC.2